MLCSPMHRHPPASVRRQLYKHSSPAAQHIASPVGVQLDLHMPSPQQGSMRCISFTAARMVLESLQRDTLAAAALRREGVQLQAECQALHMELAQKAEQLAAAEARCDRAAAAALNAEQLACSADVQRHGLSAEVWTWCFRAHCWCCMC